MVAAATVYTARIALNKSLVSDEILEIQMASKKLQVMECAKKIVSYYSVAMVIETIKEFFTY